MHPALPTIAWFAALAVAGCATFPELDAAVTDAARTAPALDLVDYRILLAASDTSLEAETAEDLEARSAALKDRAEGLVGPVIPPADAEAILSAAERLEAESARVAPEG